MYFDSQNIFIKTLIVICCFLFAAQFSNAQNYFFDSTIEINKQPFRISTKAIGNELVLLTATNQSHIALADTIYSNGLSNLQFIDFNKDGNADILLTYLGNNSSYDLYLFDTADSVFKKLTGFSKFGDAVALKNNSNYYYNYQRAGCADMNWVSNLFTIQNFEVIHLGYIDGRGCDSEAEIKLQSINIYKVMNNDLQQKKKITKLSYHKHIPAFEDKWTFIEQYWNKNYIIFE